METNTAQAEDTSVTSGFHHLGVERWVLCRGSNRHLQPEAQGYGPSQPVESFVGSTEPIGDWMVYWGEELITGIRNGIIARKIGWMNEDHRGYSLTKRTVNIVRLKIRVIAHVRPRFSSQGRGFVTWKISGHQCSGRHLKGHI